MDKEFERVARMIKQAGSAEEVFGEVSGTGAEQEAGLKKAYHRLARLTHPDRFTNRADKAAAEAAFRQLTDWYRQAQERLQAGVYGQAAGSLLLWTRKRTYILSGAYTERGLYQNYTGVYEEDGLTYPVVIKLARDPHDNDLAQNEARALQILAAGRYARKFWPYVPRLLDSFLYEVDGVGYQANVFERVTGWHTLEAVRQAYPGGLDPRDMAWMWRRLLVALGYANINGLAHGAVLPTNVLIHPEQHGLLLAEWSFSALEGETIPAIDPDYAGWYPAEVGAQEAPGPGTDIAMAARCMIYLLGGDPPGNACPASTPGFLRAFFKGCTLPGKNSRPQDAWALKEEFDELIQRFWGERKFRPFVMEPEHSNI